eukprot:167031-Lingulodinium_polyedra.AAC.1
MIASAKALVSAAGGRAILYTYGSDCTPMKLKVICTDRLDSGLKIMRKASQGAELLVEKAFLKTTSPLGEPQ